MIDAILTWAVRALLVASAIVIGFVMLTVCFLVLTIGGES